VAGSEEMPVRNQPTTFKHASCVLNFPPGRVDIGRRTALRSCQRHGEIPTFFAISTVSSNDEDPETGEVTEEEDVWDEELRGQ
jgi:hypothetical protein